jgi:gas vesicle protein
VTPDITRDEIERLKSSIRSHEISPELVLVDPELGRLARIALIEEAEETAAARAAALEAEHAQEQPPVVPAYYALDPPNFVTANTRRTEKSAATAAPAPSRILALTSPSILSVSILMNLMLAGVLFAGSGGGPTLVSPEPTAIVASTTPVQNAPASATTVRSSTRAGQRHPAKPSRKQTSRRGANRLKATAERTVLALVQTAPRSRIAQLIDATSGLLKNNVQSVCRRSARKGPARFLCVVRSPDAPNGAGLYVRYNVAANGRWSVTWLGYRTGRTHR